MVEFKLLKQQHGLPALAQVVSGGAAHCARADYDGIV